MGVRCDGGEGVDVVIGLMLRYSYRGEGEGVILKKNDLEHL